MEEQIEKKRVKRMCKYEADTKYTQSNMQEPDTVKLDQHGESKNRRGETNTE